MNMSSWPAWYYGPNNQAEIFQNADEVPPGWVDHPSKAKGGKKLEEPEDGDGEIDEITAEEMVEVFGQDDLIKMIDDANEDREEDDQIEYLGNWSKVKLAQALIDAEVEIEMPEGEEE